MGPTGNASAPASKIALLAAVIRFAERGAEFTSRFIRHLNKDPKSRRPINVSGDFVLELGAILQIWLWERAGIRPFLQADLPDSMQALESLWSRVGDAPTEYFHSKSGSQLQSKILQVFLTHCAFAAPVELGGDVDILILGSSDDSLLEEFADFVWQHRHLVTTEG